MADAAAAQAPAIDAPAAPAPAAGVGDRAAVRANRRAAAIARLQGGHGAGPTLQDAAAETAQVAAPVIAKPAEVAPPAPAAPAPAPKLAEVAPEKPDPATERGLRTIEQARKKFLDEQTAWKVERDAQLAEIARLRKEAEGKVAVDDVKKMRPLDLIERLEHYTEDDWEALGRGAFPRTKAGKADPARAAQAASEAQLRERGRAAAAEVAELRETVKKLESELRGEFTRRDQVSYAERWISDAVKAIPADKPSFLSKLHANEPETAKRELLLIGAELEKANDGEAPTHAEVIAEFEKRKRAALKAMGLDADALLAPPAPAAAKPAAQTRTLAPGAANMTRAVNAPKTREEKRAIAVANLRARAATADNLP